MYVLGVSAFYHDSAVCLLHEGRIVAAAPEEAFSRVKHDAGLPVAAAEYCLRTAGIGWDAIDWIAYYELPELKLDRIRATHAVATEDDGEQRTRAFGHWNPERMDIGRYFKVPRPDHTRVFATEHHLSHAASAFYPSPFEEAAVLTIDGVGEYATTSIAHGRGREIRQLCSVDFPHSLGLLYSAFTYYAGFKVNSGEYKLMGLAPYGEPRYVDRIEQHLVRIGDDGAFRLNMAYFRFLDSPVMIAPRFEALFGAPTRRPEEPIEQHHMDVARSIQVVLEKAVLALARRAHALTGARKLCMAGGVALNCVANGRVLREGPFDEVWVQPAAGDAGGAIGAAMYAWHQHLGHPRVAMPRDAMQGALLGPAFTDEEIREYLVAANATFQTLDTDALLARTAELLASGNVIGWFQGRMEFGPRALGCRSILGDPRDAEMQRRLNLKIKGREGFRPFAPAVLEEDARDYFDFDARSPYMLFTAPVSERVRIAQGPGDAVRRGLDRLHALRSTIPAVTHVDGSARLQTVGADAHPLFRKLLEAFRDRTGCPVLVNTSFNVRGEPIVCTPYDALRCFLGTEMDYLVLGHHLLSRTDQRDALVDTGRTFEAD